MDQSIATMPSPLTEIEDHLTEATTELFDAYGITIGPVSGDLNAVTANGVTVTSTVGFAGENLRGALVLSTSLAAVQRWRAQLGGGDITPDSATDTIGEFCNMLLGRLKYSLLLRGVTILLATPTTAMGRQMTLPPPSGCASRWLRFDGEAGRVDVRLDISFATDFAFATETPREAPAGAGEMMMF